MAADDAADKDTPNTTDEPEDKEDVEGHRNFLTPDPEVRKPKASDDDKSDPVEGLKGY